MSAFSFRSLTFMVFITFLIWSSQIDTCNARRGKHWRQSRASSASLYKKKGKNHHQHHGNNGKSKHKHSSPKAPPVPEPNIPPSPPKQSPSTVFNVLDFGARGDGICDDTKAFQAAWAAACKVEASTMMVPSEFTFLVGPISFSGSNCNPNIVFQDCKLVELSRAMQGSSLA